MKTTYTGTLFYINNLVEATVKVFIHDIIKYEDENMGHKVTYTGVKSWDIIQGGEEAKAIEIDADVESMDPFHEYLVLHFENGDTATFRNSFVDMFII